ncbi:hypothetical protein [Haladaptatus halobius]|uniref:hypothetical protein n=1 Tax=Haladaptatus halobius TaxID=2884875 RepID=UPI001D0AD8BD|nr:hypothetical protein [Haladaptatus halobius]
MEYRRKRGPDALAEQFRHDYPDDEKRERCDVDFHENVSDSHETAVAPSVGRGSGAKKIVERGNRECGSFPNCSPN